MSDSRVLRVTGTMDVQSLLSWASVVARPGCVVLMVVEVRVEQGLRSVFCMSERVSEWLALSFVVFVAFVCFLWRFCFTVNEQRVLFCPPRSSNTDVLLSHTKKEVTKLGATCLLELPV